MRAVGHFTVWTFHGLAKRTITVMIYTSRCRHTTSIRTEAIKKSSKKYTHNKNNNTPQNNCVCV